MSKLLSLFVLILFLASCSQKAENISKENVQTNSGVSVENMNNLKNYKSDKFGIEFQYLSNYIVTEDTEKTISIRKIGDLEEEKNGDGVCLNCSLAFVYIPKFLGNTEIKTPEEWIESQKKVDMNYLEKLISGKKAYYYKNKENLREYYLVYVKNGNNYDRYDFSFKADDTNASKILSSIKFKENIEETSNSGNITIKESVIKDVVVDGKIEKVDEDWNKYTNEKLGFSIKYPVLNYDGYSIPPTKAVPVHIIEDKNVVFIGDDSNYGMIDNKEYQKLAANINKYAGVNYSFFSEKVNSDKEIEKFIKNKYGKYCGFLEKKETNKKGIYKVIVKSTGFEDPKPCVINYYTTLLYNKEKGIVIAWDNGQAVNFQDKNGGSLDKQINDSFEFIK